MAASKEEEEKNCAILCLTVLYTSNLQTINQNNCTGRSTLHSTTPTLSFVTTIQLFFVLWFSRHVTHADELVEDSGICCNVRSVWVMRPQKLGFPVTHSSLLLSLLHGRTESRKNQFSKKWLLFLTYLDHVRVIVRSPFLDSWHVGPHITMLVSGCFVLFCFFIFFPPWTCSIRFCHSTIPMHRITLL